jgi:protein ImuA
MPADSPYGQVVGLPQRPPAPAGAEAPRLDAAVLRDVLLARTSDPSATAFVLSCLAGRRVVLWVQDRLSRRENGRPYGVGLGHFGLAAPVLHVEVSHPRDVLWAMEEGAASGGLAAVVGEIHGAPGVLDFTATKRLALRAEASGVPVWLIRSGDPGTLSAARERWRIGALPSPANPHDASAPGAPQWEAELFRARGRPPGCWIASHDRAGDSPDRLRLVPRPGDRALAADGQPRADAAGG